MWYIGTSLGKCLKSILMGEVPEDKVLLIVTATDTRSFEQYMKVVDMYYKDGNHYSRNPELYTVFGVTEEEYKTVAARLWNEGKIHQPRNFPDYWGGNALLRDQVWLQVVPTNQNSTPAVVDAYEKYKVLDALTKND